MPYVIIPRDVTKVKSKVALGLTKRQLICAACAAAIGLPVFWFSRKVLGNDIAFYLMVFLVAPFGLMAFYEKNGMPFEKYIAMIIRWRYVRPRVRYYGTDNIWDAVNQQITLEKEINQYVAQNEEQKKYAAGKKSTAKKRHGKKTDGSTAEKNCKKN